MIATRRIPSAVPILRLLTLRRKITMRINLLIEGWGSSLRRTSKVVSRRRRAKAKVLYEMALVADSRTDLISRSSDEISRRALMASRV